MNLTDYILILVFLILLFGLSPFIGRYIARLFDREQNGIIEKSIYHYLKIDTSKQSAKAYLKSLLQFSVLSMVVFFIIVFFFPGAKSPMSWHLAINTAISFVTNTNWQAYSGELSLTPAMQMLSCTVQNFLSAGVGIAVLVALVRGLREKNNLQEHI